MLSRPSAPCLLDQIGALLANAVRRHLRVSAVEDGHDTAVGHAEVLDALDAQFLVDDALGIICFAHGAGAGRVVA